MIKIGGQFSGVGAFDEALKRLKIRYKNVYQAEWDKYARITYLANNKKPYYYVKDVYDTPIKEITDKYGSIDIVMFSPPCQSFSLAGKRKGEDDERGVLFYESLKFIKINKPRFFIFENVKGLLSIDKGQVFGRWKDMLGGKSINGNVVLFHNKDSVPYHIYWRVLNAKDYNIPQNRERVFIVGIRDDEDNYFRWPKKEPLTKKLKDVLEENVDEKYYLSDKMINCLAGRGEISKGYEFKPTHGDTIASSIVCKSGQYSTDNYIKIKSATKKGYEIATDGDSINLQFPDSKTRRGRVGKEVAQTLDTNCEQGVMIGAFRGRNPNNPSDRATGAPTEQRLEINQKGTSNTITSVQKDNVVIVGKNYIQWDASGKGYYSQQDRVYYEDNFMGTLGASNGGNKHNVLLNNYRIRKLTPRECFRLMDFPESFTCPVSDSQAYKQAGNSIVIKCLELIIKGIQDKLVIN